MVLSMRERILMVRRKDKENLHLQTAVITKVNLSRMRYADLENISGLMVSNMKDSGAKIKCMVKEHSYGKIKRSIKVSS